MGGIGKMNAEIMGALDQLEREKGIPKNYMLEKISAGVWDE